MKQCTANEKSSFFPLNQNAPPNSNPPAAALRNKHSTIEDFMLFGTRTEVRLRAATTEQLPPPPLLREPRQEEKSYTLTQETLASRKVPSPPANILSQSCLVPSNVGRWWGDEGKSEVQMIRSGLLVSYYTWTHAYLCECICKKLFGICILTTRAVQSTRARVS